MLDVPGPFLTKTDADCRSEEHVDMVKQLVQARIDNEATESELIRYKTM
jgi:hypothetical protein